MLVQGTINHVLDGIQISPREGAVLTGCVRAQCNVGLPAVRMSVLPAAAAECACPACAVDKCIRR